MVLLIVLGAATWVAVAALLAVVVGGVVARRERQVPVPAPTATVPVLEPAGGSSPEAVRGGADRPGRARRY